VLEEAANAAMVLEMAAFGRQSLTLYHHFYANNYL
jgi:hypothetical protein